MENNELGSYLGAPQVESGLAKPGDLDKEIVQKSAGDGFIPGLRIIQGNNVDDDNPVNSYQLGTDTNIGREIKVVLSLHRHHAIRFKDNKVDAEDFNLTPNSYYNAAENKWYHPDGYTPGYREIMEKKVPDSQNPLISNCAGFDLLLWLVDHQKFATFLLARTALKMPEPNIFETARLYRGRTAILSAKTVGNKFRWSIPQIRLLDEENSIPNDGATADIIQKFLNPGVVYDPDATEAPAR